MLDVNLRGSLPGSGAPRERRRGRLLRPILTGRGQRNLHGWWLAAATGVYILGFAWGIAKYPGGFSMFQVFVSYLGSPEHNPAGYRGFNAAQCLTGLMLIPHFLYIGQQLTPRITRMEVPGIVLGVAGCLGLSSQSVLWQGGTPPWAHLASTVCAFGGFASSFLLLGVSCLGRVLHGYPYPALSRFSAVYGQVGVVIGAMLVLTNFPGAFAPLNLHPGLFDRDHFWEHLYVAATLTWVVGLFVLVSAPSAAPGRPAVNSRRS